MRNKNRRWIIFWFLVPILQLAFSDDVDTFQTNGDGESGRKSVYVPRMDYEQWKPLGRGDPLKNDPTYDYVPPVLDRVQYWLDPAMRKSDSHIPGENKKSEILLLGVTSRKPANLPQIDSRKDTYDPYTTYVEGSKLNQNPNQRISRPSFLPPLPSSFLPAFFSSTKNRTPFSKGTEQRVPYTMLMPPPLESAPSLNNIQNSAHLPLTQSPIIKPSSSSTPKSTSPAISVQTADLVYHSTSVTNHNDWSHDEKTVPSNWEQSSTRKPIPEYRDEIVYSTHLTLPESYMRVEFRQHNITNRPLLADESNHNINYVTPPPLIKNPEKEMMFKGQVSDGDVDISNSYVKIGKPEAEVHSTGIGISNVPIVQSNMIVFPHSIQPPTYPTDLNNLKITPLTMHKINNMQTMHPPAMSQTIIFPKASNNLIRLLDKERQTPILFEDNATTQKASDQLESHPSSIILVTTNTTAKTTSTTETFTTTEQMNPTTITDAPISHTTISSALTTDPLFKHYKQPVEPIRGPLYLIIQGHSKVKTYGPSTQMQMHGIPIQDTNEIPDNEDNYEVKHLHGFKKNIVLDEKSRKGRSGNIQTLKHVVQTGLGAIDLTDIDEGTDRSDKDFLETELQVGYEVVDNDNATEKYHKGIVEEARKLEI